MLERLAITVERVVIDDLSNGTYYATLHLLRDSERFGIDARPSDAIAVGLRADAPLFVTEAVMSTSGEVVADDAEEPDGEPEEGPGAADSD
jgi:bifunctional DNase/RNase